MALEDLSLEEVNALIEQKQQSVARKPLDQMSLEEVNVEIAKRQPQPEGNEFTRGIARGTENLKSLISEGAPALAKGIVNKTASKLGLSEEPIFDNQENLQQYQKEVQATEAKYPTKFASFKDITKQEGVGNTLDALGGYIASAAGEGLPSIVLSVAGGGAGALGAKFALGQAMKRAGTVATEAVMNQALKRGVAYGALAASAPMNIPETYLGLLAKGKDDPMMAVTVGGLKTALDTITPTMQLGKILGTTTATDVLAKHWMKRLGIEAAKGFGSEGLTESAQEGLDVLAEHLSGVNPDIFSAENFVRVADAGLRGAIPGGITGGVTHVAQSAPTAIETGGYKAQDKEYVPNPKNADKFKEEVVGPLEGEVVEVQQELPLQPPKPTGFGSNVKLEDYNPAGALRESVLEVQADLHDSTVLHPLNIDEAHAETAKRAGVNLESLSKLTVEKRAQTFAAMDAVMKAIEDNKKSQPGPKPGKKAQGSLNLKQALESAHEQKHDLAKIEVNDAQKLQEAQELTSPPVAPKTQETKVRTPRKAKLTTTPKAKAPIAERTKPGDKVIWKGDNTFKLYTVLKSDKNGVILANPDSKTVAEIHVTHADISHPAKQQAAMIDSEGNLYHDYVVMEDVKQNVEGSPLTALGEQKFQDILKAIKRLVKETTGTGELRFFDQLRDGVATNPIFGMQFMNMIFMAINDATTMSQALTTAYHEVWHMFESRGVFSRKMIHMLDNNTHLLKKYADQDSYLKGFDFDTLMKDQVWREELRANAFSRYAMEYNKTKEMPKDIPYVFRSAFKQAKNILEKIRNALRGLGFNSIEDMFDSAIEGKHAIDNIADARYTFQVARYMKGAKQTEDTLNQARQAQPTQTAQELDSKGKSRKASNDAGISYGWWSQKIRSIWDLAQKDPMAAAVYAAVDRKFQNSTAYLNSYLDHLGDYLAVKRDERYRIADLADRLSNIKTKAYLDADGALTWTEAGQVKRIKDPSVGKQYMALQKTFAQVLNDSEEVLKKQAAEAHPQLLKENFNLIDAHAALKVAEAGRKESAKAEATYQSVKNLVDRLHDFEDMRKHDYFPKMRFGTYGFVVRDKEGNQVALHTIEKGFKEGTYNEFQMKQAMQEIKEKYSDTSKYTVIGGDGQITDFSGQPKPFTMNYNRKSRQLSDQLLTRELIFSLLYTKGADQTSLRESIDGIKLDMLEAKFEKRFNESKNIAGYSKDYDRVIHAYITGASHFLASEQFAKEASRLQAEVENLQDESGTLRQTLDDYLKYTSSPQEDFQGLRTLNFLWTMGGNISTALLQVVTLPTMTLGLMTGFSPNVFKNMQLISKHFAQGVKALATSDKALLNQGQIRFSDIIENMVSDQLLKNANKRWQSIGKTAGLAVENQGKLKTYETDTNLGKLKEKTDYLSRLLGKPVSVMEQLTRYATLNATRELIATDKEAASRAQKMLENNPLFQEVVKNNPNVDFPTLVAEMTMDNAHGVFGKQGRPDLYRGLNGALFMPFQVYPHYALEGMVRMYGQGKDGKRALATTLAAMFLIGGLMGLPGMDVIKELLEALENQLTGSEEDYQYMIQQKIYGLTGSMALAQTLTGGVSRGVLGMDISKRTGLGIPGQEIPLTLLGIRGSASTLMGVQGSIIDNTVAAWNGYNNGDQGLPATVASVLLPNAATNLMKAVNMGDEGVKTRNGNQLLTANEVSAQTRLLKGLGITSDQLATARESAYYDTLIQGKYKVGLDRFRKQVTNIKADIVRARAENNMEEVSDQQQKLRDTMQELRGYVKDNKIRPFPYAAFNKSTNTKAMQATKEKPSMKSINKASRREVREKNKMYEGILEQ